MRNELLLVCLLFSMAGCTSVTLPLQEFVLARSAMESAEVSEAERLAPGTYQQAQFFYSKAERLYEDRDYDEARVFFMKARKMAEKAESSARIKKSKSGEVL